MHIINEKSKNFKGVQHGNKREQLCVNRSISFGFTRKTYCSSWKTDSGLRKKEIAFTAYDDNGAVLGAVVGEIVWNHLHVSLLGIDQTMQKQGVGQKLLHHIEEYAQQFGARVVILETMSWQAPKFYQKNGYQIFGTVENHPIEGECKYYLSKVLPS